MIMEVIGIVMFFSGCYGVYWTGKRTFERRNEAGIQEFSSYGKAIGSQALEGLIRIISILAIGLGFFVFCMGLAGL